MRSTKLELASVGAFALIGTGFEFVPTDEGAGGREDGKSNARGDSKASGPFGAIRFISPGFLPA